MTDVNKRAEGSYGQERDGWYYFSVISSHDSNPISEKMTICLCVFRIYGWEPV